MDEDKNIIVCVPFDWDHTADSITVDAACGHKVWVALAGQRMIADGAEVRCIPCTVPIMKEHGLTATPAPGVLEDVERKEGAWERAKMEAHMRRIGMIPNG
jgi:hypothetical protein